MTCSEPHLPVMASSGHEQQLLGVFFESQAIVLQRTATVTQKRAIETALEKYEER